MPTLFGWPSFDTGDGGHAGGEVVAGKREGKGERCMPKGNIPGSNDAYKK